ncbi:hypothetical protein F5B21DRAFT_524716 [Xylaria acuta]|nr:hypothetical protein F5B21DRAFT_524716 [Xylaria acuta]
MPHTVQTSRTGSPPADLRPAPLRIPVRKTVAGPDDNPRTVVSRYKLGARDISTSTLSREYLSQHPQSDITRTPHRRHLGPKLQSLKSQFEILYAVNRADTSVSQYPISSYKARTSTIPRAAKPKQNLQRNLLSPSPVGSISRASTELSPRQTRTPAAPGRKSTPPCRILTRLLAHSPCTSSTIPILRHARPFIPPRGASSHHLPKSKSFRNNSPSLQQSPSATQATPGKQGMPKRLGEGSRLPAVSNITHPQQRLSFSQPVEASGGSARPSLQSKASRRSIRSKLRIELLAERPSMSPDGISRLRPPIIGRGQIVDVRPRTKVIDQTSSPNPADGSVRHGLTRQEKTGPLHAPVGLEPLSRTANEKPSQKSGNSENLDFSMDGLSVLPETPNVQHELSTTEDTPGRSPLGVFRIPKILSPGSRPTQGSGKVSRLRRFFERSPGRFSSPLSVINFHSRPGPGEPAGNLKGDYPSSSWIAPGSPTSTHTVTRRHSIVPSLNTEISVNDFFCDFVGSPNYGGTPVPASPSETAAEMESHMKHDSPVKHRIQQFEHISRDSLNADYHGKGNGAGVSSAFKAETKRNGKHYMAGGWRPIHQKGAAIWRKISNTFSRSLDSWKDCDSDHEYLNPTEGMGSDADFDRSPSLANDPRRHSHRSSSFGYGADRVSHTSPQFVSSPQTAPSIQLAVGDSSNTHSKRTSNASYGCSSPDTSLPPRIVRKRPSLVARVSSGFRWHNGFGLDGHFPSKPVREEEPQPSESRTSGPRTPRGDPNALLKVMLKQSAAERNRRRQGERHLRRDIKSRTLARWKGKGKADVDLRSVDGTISRGEAGKKQDKGKGKEKETQGQQENEPNKKTESGFVVFESKDVKLRHPKPRRPGQVRKLTNMYRDKGSSGVSVNTKASSGATLKESRLSFRQKASSAFGRRGRRES